MQKSMCAEVNIWRRTTVRTTIERERVRPDPDICAGGREVTEDVTTRESVNREHIGNKYIPRNTTFNHAGCVSKSMDSIHPRVARGGGEEGLGYLHLPAQGIHEQQRLAILWVVWARDNKRFRQSYRANNAAGC
jgi:hypothetical protein